VSDVLADEGLPAMADSLARASGDQVFARGVSMAVLRESGMNAQLLALCDSLPSGMPDSLLARGALFRARAQRALQRPAGEYYGSYLDFALRYPWHATASEAAYLTGRFYDSERDWPRAADAYMAALRSGDFGEARAHWRGGFCHYMCGRGAVGDSIWAAGIEKYPCSAWCDEMLFWRARYAGRQGDPGREQSLLREAARRHPWEFYGILAAQRTGAEAEPFRMCSASLVSDPVSAEAVDMMSRGYGAMASQMLYTTGSCDEGLRGMVLALMGEYQRSLEVLRRLDYRLRNDNLGTLPDSLLRFYFPAPYRELTESTVSGLSVPVEVVTGLMRQESNFNRWARSWVGASGLIQLMPGTAGDIARWYDLPPLSGSDFFNPESSILYGSIYLARQYSAFSGSLVLTLSAYNAGPGNAARWMEEFPLDDSDPELFIEQIPLTETREYVKHVMGNAWIYRELFR
ncbi:MAG: lytic transglycosylase domain-containing protein, partial [Candidatus Fermentibacteraceae bacterium]|nr:lytic transglycosylase domain-containing protein [Candidatus Fermentibacteraceae bacterium]